MGGLQAGTIAPCWDHSSAPCLAAGTAPCCRKLSTGLGHVPWPPLSTARQRRHGPAPNRACRGLVTGRTSSELSEAAVAKRAWRCPEVSGKHHHQISPVLQPLVLGVPAAKPAWGVRAPLLAPLRWGKVTAAFFSSSDGAAVPAPPVLPSTASPTQHQRTWRFTAQTQRQLSRYQRCLGLASVPARPGTTSPASPGRKQARVHVKHNIFIAKIGFFCSFHTQGFFPVHLRSKQVDRSSVRWADVRAALASDSPRCWVAPFPFCGCSPVPDGARYPRPLPQLGAGTHAWSSPGTGAWGGWCLLLAGARLLHGLVLWGQPQESPSQGLGVP